MAISDSNDEHNSKSSVEERFTRIDDLLREYAKANAHTSPIPSRAQPDKYHHKLKGMSHSISENNISFRPSNYSPQTLPGANSHFKPSDADGLTSWTGSEAPLIARGRGRLPDRTISPSKALDNIKEDQTPEHTHERSHYTSLPMDLPTSPTKRSRSPMKRFFGENGFLGRSTSMKELPSEEYRKKGVKQLGEKFKQRVEGMVSYSASGDEPARLLMQGSIDGRSI